VPFGQMWVVVSRYASVFERVSCGSGKPDGLNFARRSTVPRKRRFGAVLDKCLVEEATLRK